MNILIDNGILYCDNLFLCYARPGNARRNYDDGFYAVEIRTDTLNANPYLHADGVGCIRANPETDDVVLCRVLGGSTTNACSTAVEHLFALVEATSEAGYRVTLEINNG